MFWKAIEHVEKWEIGNEEFIEKWIISGVHKKRGVVTEYLITTSADQFWLSKKEAINFAIEGKLHAIVVHLKNRPAYLRPEFGTRPFDLVT